MKKFHPVALPEGVQVGFLGGGNMAEAIIRGLLEAKLVAPASVHVSEPREDRLEFLTKRYGVTGYDENVPVVHASDIVVLAVKPQTLPAVLDEVRTAVTRDKLIISVAAGVTLAEIEQHLGDPVRLVRTMPNVCAIAREGATALSGGAHCAEDDVGWCMTIFGAVGEVVRVDEYLMDAVTGLSGSGPAYIFLIIDALADAGVKVGLHRETALKLAAQTVKGSAVLLLESGEHPGRLKDMVTSPGGTAIAGVATLEQGGLRTTLINAVEAATRRAHELGHAKTNGK